MAPPRCWCQPTRVTLPAIDLERIYDRRFGDARDYRLRVWSVLIRNFFQKLVPETGTVLDLGCGWGEFVNQVRAGRRFGMDLNSAAARASTSRSRFSTRTVRLDGRSKTSRSMPC